MKWITERDALIAQTLAFVQSVTGKRDDLRQPEPAAAAFAATTELVNVRAVAVEAERPPALPPHDSPLPPAQVLPPRTNGDFRTEMQVRIASFREHQERFEREREEFCAATLTRLRAAIRDPASCPAADE
jgi:hypothetical protein